MDQIVIINKTLMEEPKMGFNPQNAKEEPALPADVVFDGAILQIEDKKVKDFVKNLAKWSDPEQTAINCVIAVLHKEKEFRFDHLFPYDVDGETTVYSPRSKLGKYKAKYNKLPEVGDKVKVMTNTEGFLRLKLD